MADDLETRATGFLKTIGPDVAATLVDAPRSTIIPRPGHSTGGGHAMAMLAQLSGSGTGKLVRGEVIGEGGMGVIRAAEQVALGRTVAVKTVKPQRRDPSAALDLLREAWVTGSLEHPNIVPVHYLELDEHGMPVIVLKRITGSEWSSLYDDAAAVEARFGKTDLLAWNLDILLDVLNALRFAHSRGIVHRDLKPSNVMIGDFGEVYLLDWGIAVSLVDDGSGRIALAADAKEPAGTPCYMAPEMLGSAPITERTDVYLVGAVLFEIIAHRPPHEGRSAIEVITNVLHSRPKLPDGVPAELAAICLCALDPDPDKRFPTADAFRVAISSYLEHRGSANIATRARQRFGELEMMLAAKPVESDEAAHREAVYRVFGACRFGFHEALSVWPTNADARDGLARATCAMAEYELAVGNPETGVTLLRDLADAPAELVARAKKAAGEAAVRRAELEKLGVLHDSVTGRRTRGFLTGLLGVTFTILPLLAQAFPGAIKFDTHRGNMIWAIIALGLVGACVFWARDSMRATLFNRRIVATGAFLFIAQFILSLGASILELPVAHAQVTMIFLWGTMTAIVGITVDPWLFPSSAWYFACFLFAASRPDLRYYAMAAGNFAFGMNALISWRPTTFKQTPEERAWVEDQKRKRGAIK